MIVRPCLVVGLVAGAIAGAGCHATGDGKGGAGDRVADGSGPSAVGPDAGSTEGSVGPTSKTAGASTATSRLAPRQTEAVFSAPIAATRAARTSVVAGLVAARGVVRAVGWPDEGPPWSVDVLQGVAWTPDAELSLDAAGDDVAVVWRGSVGGKPSHAVVVVGAHGEPRGDAVAVGGSFCATATGLAWIEASPHGPSRVRARGLADAAVHDVAIIAADRAASVLCGEHDVFALGDGDDDLIAMTFGPEEARASAPAVVIRDADFGDDDERDHHAYTFGDTLGLARVSSSGAVALRDVTREGPGPWHRLKHKVGADDDVVATDGDAAGTTIVSTRGVEDACDGAGTTETVRAIHFDRASGQDAVVDLARPDCHVARGPFWIGAPSAGPTVSWVERAHGGDAGSAPISALAFGAGGADAGIAGRFAVGADAIVQGACGVTCWVAALVRTPDADGSQPEAIAVLAYP